MEATCYNVKGEVLDFKVGTEDNISKIIISAEPFPGSRELDTWDTSFYFDDEIYVKLYRYDNIIKYFNGLPPQIYCKVIND